MVEAYIGLGANMGDAAEAIEAALRRLDAAAGVRLVARTSLYRTAAWGVTDQPDFVNAVACVATSLDARPLLDLLLAIERDAGRDRARSFRTRQARTRLD
jgi:2-amino-4-hydroxy-6-hydroxymethyldihydropteridine diphosphokinase